MGVRGRKLQKPKVTYKSRTMTIRKPISKELRRQVYDKYNGHCAYCGCELEYKDMQVDHIVAVGRSYYDLDKEHNEILQTGDFNRISNLMPSCRKCNFYKDMDDIEGLRNKIKNILSRSCVNTFQAQLAIRYGIITHHEWNGKFYFEQCDEQNSKASEAEQKLKELGVPITAFSYGYKH